MLKVKDSGAEESKTKTWKSRVGHEEIHKN
jgi:hypothetical protein